LAPWYIFLFVGALDFGIYSYSLIATQTAARVAAMYCSTSLTSPCVDSSTSAHCGYVLDQLRMLPNVGSALTTCGTGTSVTSSSPVAVSSSTLSAGDSPDGMANSAIGVTVVYMTPLMIPIPKMLPGQLTISRTVKMRFRS
jgi:hypothetical protein